MNRQIFALDLKLAPTASATGEIDGYASVFNVRDSHGDVIEPGAFRKSLEQRRAAGRSLPAMYMQHDAALGADPRPVGVWTEMAEDQRGLRVKGRLSGLDTETGRYNLALIRDGAMRGLSIGYRVFAGGSKALPGGGRTLTQIDLFEVSIVDQPSNAKSLIDGLKTAAAIRSARDFEAMLRDHGFSKGAARKLAGGGWAALKSVPKTPGGGRLAALTDRVNQAAANLLKTGDH